MEFDLRTPGGDSPKETRRRFLALNTTSNSV